MSGKEDLKKQLIVLGLILILVIIVAIILNTGKNKNISNNNITNNIVIENEVTEEQKILDNLKGLLEDSNEDEEYIQDETQGTKENKITTNNGETVIIRE